MPQALPRKMVHRLVLLNAMLSYLMGSLGFSIQLIKRDFELTRVHAAWHNIGWATALVFISLVLLSHGHRRPAHQTMRIGWFVVVAGTVVYCLSPNVYFSIPAIALAASGSVITGNTATAILGSHSKTALKNMFRATGVGLFMGSVSPTVIGVTTQVDVPWRWTVAISAVIVGAVAQLLIPELDARPEPSHEERKINWDKHFIAIIIFAFLSITMEVALSSWAVDLLSERGTEVKTAVLFATIAPYFVALSRIYLSTKSEFNLPRIWAYCFAATTLGIAIVVFTTSPILTLVGLVIAAAGIGPCASIAIALASGSEQGSDRGIAAFVMGMGISNGASPWIMGYVSENYGFEAAYGVIFVVLILTTLTFTWVLKNSLPQSSPANKI
ncbi:MAG: MFS transporter [Candidatus Planktophila sp.]|nr:MFS transporter [Candidatus Planktophila sp.]